MAVRPHTPTRIEPNPNVIESTMSGTAPRARASAPVAWNTSRVSAMPSSIAASLRSCTTRRKSAARRHPRLAGIHFKLVRTIVVQVAIEDARSKFDLVACPACECLSMRTSPVVRAARCSGQRRNREPADRRGGARGSRAPFLRGGAIPRLSAPRQSRVAASTRRAQRFRAAARSGDSGRRAPRAAFVSMACSSSKRTCTVPALLVLHHTPDPRAAFARIAPLARPGGMIVVGLYNSVARIPFRLRRLFGRFSDSVARASARAATAGRLVSRSIPASRRASAHAGGGAKLVRRERSRVLSRISERTADGTSSELFEQSGDNWRASRAGLRSSAGFSRSDTRAGCS